ncbi:DUF2232 domain-containing protein [Tissierellaceae bacterium HCP3S3_D8]
MNYDDRIKRRTIETILLITIMALYTVFGLYYIPYILLLLPAPFIAFGVKNGIISNVINMIITCMIVGLIDSFGTTLFLIISFIPITIVSSYLIKKKRKNTEILGISAIVFFISLLIILSFVDAGGGGFVAQLEEGFKQLLSAQLDMFKDMDLTSYEILKLEELLENAYKYLLLIMPAILLVLSLVVSYLNYLLATIGLKKMKVGIFNIPKFSRFRLPNNIIPGMLIMFSIAYIMKKMEVPYNEAILVNLVVLVGFMFVIQGLSIVDYFFTRMRVYPIIRVILYILFLFNSPMVTIISILGFIDIIFDIRRIRKSSFK